MRAHMKEFSFHYINAICESKSKRNINKTWSFSLITKHYSFSLILHSLQVDLRMFYFLHCQKSREARCFVAELLFP